jgi:ElaA protein
MSAYRFVCKPFYGLSLDELYALMTIRQEVFIVEQNCPYLDADGKDQGSWHILMYSNATNHLVGCTRLLPQGLSYPEYMSIGRVLNTSEVRGTGAGKALMLESVRQIQELFGPGKIKIGAQSYLVQFYGGFGFVSTGEEYLEDGIPHTKMIRP